MVEEWNPIKNFIIQEHLLKEEPHRRYIYPVDAKDISDFNWKDRLRKNNRIHTAWTSVLSEFEVLGLCIGTKYYVSTRGGG